MKKITSVFLAFALCASTSFAQTLPSLLIGSDVASQGSASTAVGKTSGAYSLEGNVASMPLAGERLSAAASFGLWQPAYAGDKVIGVGVAGRPGGRFALGLQFKSLLQPSYDVAAESGSVKGTFTPGETNVALGAAYSVTDWLSVGLSGRMVRSVLAEEAKANVFGADVAVFLKRDAFSAGLSVNNLGGKVNYGGEDYDQPSLAKAGAAYRFGGPESSSVTTSVEADFLFKGGFMAGVGVEYSFRSVLFVRGGFHYGDSERAVPTYASLGLGTRIKGVCLDLAWLTAGDVLGNSLSAGVGYRF